ncbi:hypothetical protein ScPMuIL_010693 [Solemya velum]
MYRRRDSRENARKAFSGVGQARYLATKSQTPCGFFVRISVYSEHHEQVRFETRAIWNSSNPDFNQESSLQLSESDFDKRLLISVCYVDDNDKDQAEVLGCMSFGLQHLAKRESRGWFYLLTKEIGLRRHVPVCGRSRSVSLGARGIPSINKDIKETEDIQVTVYKGKQGFGFTVAESCPVKIGEVMKGSPAECSGLDTGDVIIKVNGLNVSRSTSVSVWKLIKCSSDSLFLVIKRSQSPSITSGYSSHSSTKKDTTDSDQSLAKGNDQNEYNTASPLICNARTTLADDANKMAAIRRLLHSEMDFVDFMNRGMQLFSRPLRHSILNSHQYNTLFQNIEKIVAISENLVKQLSRGISSGNMDMSIGQIYQLKIHILEEAYILYSKGFSKSLQILTDLTKLRSCRKFIKKVPSCSGEPSISGFVFRPIMHIQALQQIIQELYASSDCELQRSLSQVAEGLNNCVCHVNNNDRAQLRRSNSSRTSVRFLPRRSVRSLRSMLSRGSSFLDTMSIRSVKPRKSETSLNFSRMS